MSRSQWPAWVCATQSAQTLICNLINEQDDLSTIDILPNTTWHRIERRVLKMTSPWLANIKHDFYSARHSGAHLQAAPDDEARQEPLRDHLRDRAGAAGPGQVHRRRHGAGVSSQDRDVLPQAQGLSLLRPLLCLLGPQQSRQGEDQQCIYVTILKLETLQP